MGGWDRNILGWSKCAAKWFELEIWGKMQRKFLCIGVNVGRVSLDGPITYSSVLHLKNLWACSWKLMICPGHRLQCKMPQCTIHKFPRGEGGGRGNQVLVRPTEWYYLTIESGVKFNFLCKDAAMP